MSKMIITSKNAAQWISSLLNLDISALQTAEMAQCRETVWELRQSQNKLIAEGVDPRWESAECLGYCIQRLFSCLSEEAQRVISQGIDKHSRLEIE